jgi:nucleotide-binding universal stress UspA family protein
MESYPRVLVGTDGSPEATAGVRIGGKVAARLGVPLEVITVWEEDDEEKDRDWAVGITDAAEALVKELGVGDVTSKQISGKPADVMVDATSEQPESLVVVGSAGLSRATSRLVGSTSNRLVHHSRADVLFAHDPLPQVWNFVALATDGSKTSHQAVRRGLGLAVALGATPRLVNAAKSEAAGERVLAATWDELGLGEYGVEIEREILVGTQPATSVIAAGWKYELVAIGNRGTSGPARLLGSTANKIAHGLKTNLLLVNTTRI